MIFIYVYEKSMEMLQMSYCFLEQKIFCYVKLTFHSICGFIDCWKSTLKGPGYLYILTTSTDRRIIIWISFIYQPINKPLTIILRWNVSVRRTVYYNMWHCITDTHSKTDLVESFMNLCSQMSKKAANFLIDENFPFQQTLEICKHLVVFYRDLSVSCG